MENEGTSNFKVKLLSSDAVLFELPYKAAVLSSMVQNLIEGAIIRSCGFYKQPTDPNVF
jgi:hypothetical protein